MQGGGYVPGILPVTTQLGLWADARTYALSGRRVQERWGLSHFKTDILKTCTKKSLSMFWHAGNDHL